MSATRFSPSPWAGFVRPTSDSTIMNGLEPSHLRKIEKPDALPDHLNVEPRNLRPVSAYNWTDRPGRNPTIIVPGMYIRTAPSISYTRALESFFDLLLIVYL